MIDIANKPYSANVQLVLHVNGQDYPLAKVGPDRIYLRTPVNLPPCEGTLSINIDGHLTQQQLIRLPEGASADSAGVVTSR
ncbi:MAG: hypothetical protein R3C59_06585 [Planctomycetaceae bacterium]